MQQAAAAAPHLGAATGDINQAVGEGGTGDTMDRHHHIGQRGPPVGARVVHIVVGEHPRAFFATPNMHTTKGHGAVDAAARLEHGRSHSPLTTLEVKHLMSRGFIALKSTAQTTTDHMQTVPNQFHGDMVALAG